MLERILHNRVTRFFSGSNGAKKGNNDRNYGSSKRCALFHENRRVTLELFQSNLTGKGDYFMRWRFNMNMKTYF